MGVMDVLKDIDLLPFLNALDGLHDCSFCPRACHADRFSGKTGYCKSDAYFSISSICIHHGEEPAISGPNGICNVFFGHCNLQCIYCQNYQISDNMSNGYHYTLRSIINDILSVLDRGIPALGFVSPTHQLYQMNVIINILHALGRKPVIVYNSNGYDKVEELRKLEGIVDVYLPDFKYMDTRLGKLYSDVNNYPEVALEAIREMYRQKGSTVVYRRDGIAESGLIIRHLVLPGHVENSTGVLECIARELSPSVTISLMSQYYPTYRVKDHPVLGRRIALEEYSQVVRRMESLGFYKGWIQDMESASLFEPDFEKGDPFE
jgi:putative pyruvate formate lyase activating enzyme